MSETGEIQEHSLISSDRRQFLKTAALAAVTAASAPTRRVMAALQDTPGDRKALSLYHVHTDEQAYAIYWQNGQYNPKGLYHVDYILRDVQANELMPIDPRLVDLIHAITNAVDAKRPVHVISGYRTPQTEKILRNTQGDRDRSRLHMSGRAVDIRIPGIPTLDLHQAAVELNAGGVGYYPVADSVHIDIGRVRYW